MEGIKNINKKLRISIFTALFLIGFVYSVYSQATSEQNNAVSSLESNLIIQELINSSFNGYSTAGQYLANFLSINNVPTSVWSIIIFFITVLLFIGIYTFLFEIFIQRAGIKEKENETMRKAKILSVLALSLFSAIAIGYAIPFLLSLYGFILLILVLIALFFFGRAIISYGKSFHYEAKSFAADIEKKFLEVEKELKKARKDLSDQEIKFLEEGREKVNTYLEKIDNEFNNAEREFKNTLSMLAHTYRDFTNGLVYSYNNYLSQHQQNLQLNQKEELKNFIRDLEHIRDSLHPDIKLLPPLKKLYKDILEKIDRLQSIDDTNKIELRSILDNLYRSSVLNSNAVPAIRDAINKYENVRRLLINFYGFEDGFKRNIKVRFEHLFHAPDSRKYEMGILSALNKSKNYVIEKENLIKERIKFLEDLLTKE